MNNNNNMPHKSQAGTANVKKKSAYSGFTFKEKLLPSILLSLVAPFTVCFVAPFEIYGGNTAEFKFVLFDFVGICLLIALGIAAVLCGILLACRGRAFDVVFGLIFGISLMLFLQSNYLSLGQTSLVGDGTIPPTPIGQLVLNSAIWITVIAACVLVMLLLNKYKDTVRLVATMVLVLMLFMSFVSFLTVSLTTDVYAPDKSQISSTETGNKTETESNGESSTESNNGSWIGSESESLSGDLPTDFSDSSLLTVKNLNTLSSDKNIVVFLVDRFDQRYYNDAISECPEIFEELSGFTYFNDYVSRYPRTFPAITHMITGVDTDFSLSRHDYFKKAYSQSPLLYDLKNAGYDINLYTDTYYGYDNAIYMAGYASNLSINRDYKIVNRTSLSMDMLRLSLYRSLPSCLRSAVGDIRTTTFDKYVEYNTELDVYSTDMKAVYNTLTAENFTVRNTDKGYSFIHLSGCHLPNLYDENFEPVSESDKYSTTVAMKQSFKIINAYISEMKRLGVYENSTIIITGDHASIGSDSKDPYYAHMTALLVKPAGISEGDIVTSSASIAPENIFATIRAAAGLDLPENEEWRTVFEIPENEIRKRRYLFQRKTSDGYESITYEITGNGNLFSNWKIVDRKALGKSIYS